MASILSNMTDCRIRWFSLCLKWKILYLISKNLEFIMYEQCTHAPFLCCLVFVWLNSSILFTWEINLRPCDGYYPPADTWTNTHTRCGAQTGGRACTQTQRWAYVCWQWSTNTHSMLAHGAHICTFLLGIDRQIHPMSYKHYICILPGMCSHVYEYVHAI